MGVSLITIVGKGRKKSNGNGVKDIRDRYDGYEKTIYFFDNGKSSETTIFSRALIERYKGQLDSIILLGTETSSWNVMLPDIEGKDLELWCKLEDQEKVTDEDLDMIKCRLEEENGCSVTILPPQKSDISNEFDPVGVYSKVVSHIKPKSKIVFDITSGFRYMPMLIFQTLQIHSAEFRIEDVYILYAELKNDGGIVRDISCVWKSSEINKALNVFETTLNGIELSGYLKNRNLTRVEEDSEEHRFNKKLADWIYNFSDYIQKGYLSLLDGDFFSRLINMINMESPDDNNPPFVKETVKFLKEEIASKFENLKEIHKGYRRSYSMFTIAGILNEKGLFTQAVISLRECVFMRIIEKYRPEVLKQDRIVETLENMDEYKEFPQLLESYNSLLSKTWKELKNTRNKSAHAGMELIYNKKDIEYSKKYGEYHKAVKEILEKVIPCKA